jgi:ubiquinol-cytochrome c reductase subunit 8
MATFIGKGFWNVMRRSRNQVLYFIPPMIIAYSTMQWAIERYVGQYVEIRKMRRVGNEEQEG